MISFMVAMGNRQIIGYKNEMPWHIPEELKYFKRITTGHPVVMGRKTRDSIGRNLPNRHNIILTRDKNYICEDCTIFHSITDFLQWARLEKEQEIFVIGGAEIFKETIDFADRLYITKINAAFEGDTYFPEVNWEDWDVISETKGIRNEKNNYDYTFYVYEKKR